MLLYLFRKKSDTGTFKPYDGIIVSFANDYKLAKEVYDYILSERDISNNIIVMSLEKDEIRVHKYMSENKEEIKHRIEKKLNVYLESHKNLNKYNITEFENIMVVGISKSVDKISNLKFCEICGYSVAYDEDLLLHRKVHGFGMF